MLLFMSLLFIPACGDDSGDAGIPDGDTDEELAAEIEDEESAEEDTVPDGDSEVEAFEMDSESDIDLDTEEESFEAEPEAEAPGPYDDLPAAAASLRDMLGVSTHMYQGEGENAQRNFEFERYTELGGASIREDYIWAAIEPVNDEWHFEAVATQVEMARNNGTHIVAMLAYGVGWAMSDGTTDSIDPADYADFAGHLAGEFCDDIKDYEIWNEPNISRFWTPEPNAEKYGDILKAAYTAIKAACPDARVLMGGMCSYSTEDVKGTWSFIEEMTAVHPDICNYMDVITLHPYTMMQKPSPEWDRYLSDDLIWRGQSGLTEVARSHFAAIGCGDLPVVYSEMGWPSYEITEDEHGYFLARSVLLAARDGVETYYWYTFWDGEPITEGIRPHENYFGLYGWTGTDGSERRAKPAWNAMKGLADILGDYSFVRHLSPYFELPTDVYVLAFVDNDGALALAAWDGRDNPDEGFDPPMEGGPDTHYEFDLPLPEWATTATIYNIEGAEEDSQSVEGSLHIDLTRSVRYIKLKAE